MTELLKNRKHDCHEQAADWFLRLQAGDCTEETWHEFEQWLNEDPAHAEVYHQTESTWKVMSDYAAAPEMVSIRRDALERAHQTACRRWSVTAWPLSRSYLAVAASLLLIVGVTLAFLYSQPGRQRYETGFGEQHAITLEDNSQVELDAQTRLSVAYTADARTVDLLTGQAHFNVAHDPLRPFKVHAAGQTVVALGTAFNVEILDDEVRVTLIEGRVVVTEDEDAGKHQYSSFQNKPSSSSKARQLLPGQQLVVSNHSEPVLVENINVDKATAWRRGKLIFEDEPLADAVRRVNRYSRIRIEVTDKSIGNIGISGVFNTGDMDAFVEAIEAYFPIRAMAAGNGIISLKEKG